MPDSRIDAVLAVVAELERQDERMAAELERVGGLARRAEAVRVLAAELDSLLEGVPAALAALDRDGAEARDRRAAAARALAAAEEHAADLGRRRRSGEGERAAALRGVERAREALREAGTREERLDRRREEVLEEERAARVRAGLLAAEAREVAGQVGRVARVSRSGRDAPGEGLPALGAWSDRVGAALLVVRGQLEGERDRVVREAGELGATVLEQQLAGSSVALVRRRLEEASRRSGSRP